MALAVGHPAQGYLQVIDPTFISPTLAGWVLMSANHPSINMLPRDQQIAVASNNSVQPVGRSDEKGGSGRAFPNIDIRGKTSWPDSS